MYKEEKSMSEIILTSENFENEVLHSDKPVLIDFWAAWCGPCSMLSPTIAKIAKEHPEIKVCKVNIDEQMELALKYKVASIPTLIVIKDGEVVNKNIGVCPENQILAMIE